MADESRQPAAREDPRVRSARSSDLDAVAQLEAKAFQTDRLTRRRLGALLRSATACFLVGTRGETVVAYALVLTRRGSRAARLYSLAVAPEAAGRGIGAVLLGAAEAAALARGAEELRLEVRGDNVGAIRLYERHGYRMTGRRADYYEDGMAALRYARDLRDRSPGQIATSALGRAA